MRIYHQLASYSPTSLGGVIAAGAPMFVRSADKRDELREHLCRAYDATTAFLCASGTNALQVAVSSAQARAGGDLRVAVPAFSCYDMATAMVGANASIALYDMDPETLGPDFASLERVLASGIRTIVVAYLYGIPVDWDEVRSLADRFDATVVEDAAQGHGAEWKGRPLGSLDEISVLSFGRGKGWTGGSGGAVLFRGAPIALTPALDPGDSLSESRNFAQLLAQWSLGRPSIYGIPRALPLGLGETEYRHPVAPATITRSAAAALLESQSSSATEADSRKKRAVELIEETGSYAQSIRVTTGASAGYIRFPLRLSTGIHGFADVSAALAGGIAPSYPTTLASLPPVQERLTGPERSWTGADTLQRELVTFPVHSFVTTSDFQRNLALLRGYQRS